MAIMNAQITYYTNLTRLMIMIVIPAFSHLVNVDVTWWLAIIWVGNEGTRKFDYKSQISIFEFF